MSLLTIISEIEMNRALLKAANELLIQAKIDGDLVRVRKLTEKVINLSNLVIVLERQNARLSA